MTVIAREQVAAPVATLNQMRPAGPAVKATATVVALAFVGFAVVNVAFESTGHFDQGQYADYAAAFTVMNWLVVGLKLVGAAVAVASVAPRAVLPPTALMALLWGVFATLAVYVLGSVVQAIGLLLSVTGGPEDVDLAGVGYVMFFLLAAAGFGVLAVSYSRRHQLPRRLAVLGVLAAPAVLGLVLVAMPALLAAAGVMPAR